MGLFSKIWEKRWFIRAFVPSLLFNLKKLPFSQAIKIPIILYKSRILDNSGKIIINAPIKFGMIRLGRNCVSLFPNMGITFENRGIIIFNGKVTIGNNSAISTGKEGRLEFGNKFQATAELKLACYHFIHFSENVLIGWNTLFSDTDFHLIKSSDSFNTRGKGYGPIIINENVWIANGCRIYKNVTIPAKCVIGADTVLHKSPNCPPCALITNETGISIKATNIYLDREDDKIEYTEYEA